MLAVAIIRDKSGDSIPSVAHNEASPQPPSTQLPVLPQRISASAPIGTTSSTVQLAQAQDLKPWMASGRCGEGRTAPDGTTPAQCDPNSDKPCCSANNWCGGSADHCSRGVNYAKVDPGALRTSGVPGSIGGVPVLPKKLDWPVMAGGRQYPVLPSPYAEACTVQC